MIAPQLYTCSKFESTNCVDAKIPLLDLSRGLGPLTGVAAASPRETSCGAPAAQQHGSWRSPSVRLAHTLIARFPTGRRRVEQVCRALCRWLLSGIHEKALHAVLIQASGCHANVPMSRRRNHSGLVWLQSYFAQDCTPRLFRKLAPSLGRSNWASAAVLEEGSLTPRLLSLDQGWIQRSRHDVQQGQQGQQYLTGERRCSAS